MRRAKAAAAGRVLRYVGVDRIGGGRAGAIPDAGLLAEWVEARYDSGWKRLVVMDGDHVVGGIKLDDDGRRIWWAES